MNVKKYSLKYKMINSFYLTPIDEPCPIVTFSFSLTIILLSSVIETNST